GSCNTQTKKITLNVQLARHPEECLSYVILHELCHTVVPNHGPAFKALESKYMPDWPRVRRELNGMDSDVPIW
ncbi:MAG: M48 family metallopeptidase, partial [Acutalibacteraceae bacterium]